MTTSPLVSFVIPCYKYAHYLGQCLESVLSQTCGDFEVIVMDDCSPDNTPEVVARYPDQRIQHVRQPVNKGGNANLNEGLQRARGRYIWPISADDYLCRPDALEDYLRLFRAHPDVGLVYSRNRCWSEITHAYESMPDQAHDRVFAPGEFLRQHLAGNAIIGSAMMFRAECFATTGYWDPREEIRYCPDWYLSARLALHFGVGYLSQPATTYRIHAASEIQGYLRERPAFVVEHPTRLRWWIMDEAWDMGRHDLAPMIADLLAKDYALRIVPGTGHPIPLDQPALEADMLQKGRHEATRQLVAQRIPRHLSAAYTQAGARSYAAGEPGNAAAAFRSAVAASPWRMKPWAYLALASTEHAGGIRVIPWLKRRKDQLLRAFGR